MHKISELIYNIRILFELHIHTIYFLLLFRKSFYIIITQINSMLIPKIQFLTTLTGRILITLCGFHCNRFKSPNCLRAISKSQSSHSVYLSKLYKVLNKKVQKYKSRDCLHTSNSRVRMCPMTRAGVCAWRNLGIRWTRWHIYSLINVAKSFKKKKKKKNIRTKFAKFRNLLAQLIVAHFMAYACSILRIPRTMQSYINGGHSSQEMEY